MKYVLPVVLICTVFSLSGCATMIVGIDNRDKMLSDATMQLSPIYTRSHVDLWLIWFPFWAFTGDYNQKKQWRGGSPHIIGCGYGDPAMGSQRSEENPDKE